MVISVKQITVIVALTVGPGLDRFKSRLTPG